MLKGLYDASAGMKARLAVQDVIASNLANAATSGFQQEIISIQGHLLRRLPGRPVVGASEKQSRASPKRR